jgi:NADPH:quinone reductase-like Zn-dependent oxidoreductase
MAVDERRHIRPPILKPGHARPGDVVGRYQAALAAGDTEAVVSAFEPDGYFRGPFGPRYTHRGAAELRSFYTMCFSAGGGIGLEHCAVTDDGVRCALEYNCVRWGSYDLPPQAGIGVYERGPDGLLAAARSYDDSNHRSSVPEAARMNPVNHQIRLAARPSGLPARSGWETTTEPVPVPGPGEFVVAVCYLSLDPAMLTWINARSSFVEPVAIGAVMEAGAIGRVTASRHRGFAAGEHVYGGFGVQEFACSDGTGVTKLDPLLAPLPAYLGALGITGLTAYFGLLDVGRIRAGDTVVVSGAAGAVGSVAGQIAKVKGCQVVGIAGGPDKCRWITGVLGFDAAIDYKAEDVGRALREHAPGGVDVSSTTSAARFSTRCSAGWRAARGSCSAAASPSTPRVRPAARLTTWT